MDQVFVKWVEEDSEDNSSSGIADETLPAGDSTGGAADGSRGALGASTGGRRVMAAWLVRDVSSRFGEREEVLAYLGDRPALTPALREELAELYPRITFDWDAIGRALASGPGATDVAALSDDELALGLRSLARERGLSPMDLALKLGYRQRQVLPELLAFLRDDATVARFERTSGSVYDYLTEKHPEYAFLLYKARLFFEGDEDALEQVKRDEPRGFSDDAWRARRAYWQTQLAAHRQRRRS